MFYPGFWTYEKSRGLDLRNLSKFLLRLSIPEDILSGAWQEPLLPQIKKIML